MTRREEPADEINQGGDYQDMAKKPVVKREAPLPVVRETPRAVPVESLALAHPVWLFLVAMTLSFFVLGTYARVYDPHYGWSRLVDFGRYFEPTDLPRLRRHTHAVQDGMGNDGQFYAQMAIDPSLRDPVFNEALDNPPYRARRIGLPTVAFCLGGGKPGRAVQAYALANLLFWFVLLGALVPLYRPWTGKQVLCFALGLVCFGTLTSMEHAMVDLPAAAMLFVGLAVGGWGKYGGFAAAVLTRETSVVAALGCLNLRQPLRETRWVRELGLLGLATLPFVGWMLYIRSRFGGLEGTVGINNFSWPLVAVAERFASGWKQFAYNGLSVAARENLFGWLYLDENVHETLTLTAACVQMLYFALRRDLQSSVWRTGVGYAVLCCVLGSAVWGSTFAAARVVLPMTLCFYLLLAREKDGWFWPFLVLGSLSVPYAVHEYAVYS